ncbi:MAG TPA: Adenine DNA glycosylase [Hyphomicrobiaceae bacterium MAG_BT-2024]
MSTIARTQRQYRASKAPAMALLEWYDNERRDLPWRHNTAIDPDPYRVWLSEIMLQQTNVKTVIPYFHKFLTRWSNILELAAAQEDSVLEEWAGLGYYSRARNLHACARQVVAECGGRFPEDEVKLRKLPGIGPYTAAAIAAIAFGKHATPVDGNVERVVSRLFAVEQPLPQSKSRLRSLAVQLTPTERSGDFAQAMMDLGATVCTPRRPSCLMCPLKRQCDAHVLGLETKLPAKMPKPNRPIRYGIGFLVLSEDGQLLLRRRPEKGLLARMMEVPSTEWLNAVQGSDDVLRAAPVNTNWWHIPGTISHTFTHFRLQMGVYRAIVQKDVALTLWANPSRCIWVPRNDLKRYALPSVMRKIIAYGLRD